MKSRRNLLAGAGLLLQVVSSAHAAGTSGSESSPKVNAFTKPSWGFLANERPQDSVFSDTVTPAKKSSNLAPATSPRIALRGDAFDAPVPMVNAERAIAPSVKALAKSLIFDQSYDTASYRPLPAALALQLGEPALATKREAAPTVAVESAPVPAPTSLPTTVAVAKVVVAPSAPALDPALVNKLLTVATLAPAKIRVPLNLNELVKPSNVAPAATAPAAATTASTPAPITTAANSATTAATSTTTTTTTPPKPGPTGATGTPASPGVAAVTPVPEKNVAKLLVVDEDSVMAGSARAVAQAQVHWVGPESSLQTITNDKGVTRAPYPSVQSMRYIVTAPGFLPALGYAIGGQSSVAVLVRESRFAPTIKSLGVVPDPQNTIVMGKVIDRNLRPLPGMVIDARIADPFKIFYSVGSMGVFHPQARESGSQGDFLISGIADGSQYLMPTRYITHKRADREVQDWPAYIMDFTGAGRVVTVTLQEPVLTEATTQVVDAFSLEAPADTQIKANVAGQHGVTVADAKGVLHFDELFQRSSSELIEITANGYMKTWLNTVSQEKLFPGRVALFSEQQLATVLSEVSGEVNSGQGLVLGNLRAPIFKKAIRVDVYDSRGKPFPPSRVFYFDAQNVVRSGLRSTRATNQNFVVANLTPGEWQVVVSDPVTKVGLASQVVRVDDGVVTQIQF